MRLLTEEQKHWVEVIGDFCKEGNRAHHAGVGQGCGSLQGHPPSSPYAKAFKLGLNSFEIPKSTAATRSTWLPLRLCTKRWATMTATSLPVMQTTNLALKPILIGGTPEQVKYFSEHILNGKGYVAFALTEPQSGSDASNVLTTAVKDGDEWVINGEKCFITNGGEADIVCVFAATDPTAGAKGISAFMVPTSVPSFSLSPSMRTRAASVPSPPAP